jgi:hypothetical protein
VNRNTSSRPLRPLPQRVARLLGLAGALAVLAAAAQAQTGPSSPVPGAGASAPTSSTTLRAEMGKPLQEAQEAVRAGQHADAMARLAEAEAMPELTPYERYIIGRLKAPAAFGLGDTAQALDIFERLLDTPYPSADERRILTETATKLALQQKAWTRAAGLMKRYFAGGGASAELRKLYPQVLSVLEDHAGVLRELAPGIAADEAAGRSPPEATLRLLAASQSALQDMPAYMSTLEKLAGSTGKAEYWGELIARAQRRQGFADDRLRLDVYRLRRAVGVPLVAGELGDMAFRANQAGLPAEAQALLDEGFASGLLGKDANAAADRQLREAATKAASQDRANLADGEASALKGKDGNAAFGLAMALSSVGAHERALSLMAQAQARGGLRRPDEAMLHLGLAQWRAGKPDDARRTLAAVKGADGTADLARLWMIFLASPARK